MLDFINGKKSFIIGLSMIVLGAAVLVTQETIAGVAPSDAVDLIYGGLALIGIKSAIAKTEPKG